MTSEPPQDEVRFELSADPSRPIPEKVADALRAEIETGRYPASSRLPNESELARQMRVARSSVRSALQRLEGERLVRVRRGHGWYVERRPAEAAETVDLFAGKRYRAHELFEMRIALEGLGVSLAAARADEGELDWIEKLARDHLDAAKEQDPENLLRTDEAFHLAVLQAGHNPLILPSYENVVREIEQWRLRSFAEHGSPLRSAREHTRIVRYLRNHDVAGARSAMHTHLNRLYLALPDLDEEPLDLW